MVRQRSNEPRDCGGGGGGEIGTSDTENLSNHTQPAAVPILTGNTHKELYQDMEPLQLSVMQIDK